MTIGWILEAAEDRFYETGSDIGENPELNQFECSICGSIFASITEHDQHKLSHPVRTPSIFIKGSEVTSAEFDITSVIKVNDLHFHNIPVLFMRALKVTHFRQLDDPLTVFGLGGYDFR